MEDVPSITTGDTQGDNDQAVAAATKPEISGRLKTQRAIIAAEEFWFGGVAVRPPEWNGAIARSPDEEP